jgi:hypothetical protein
LNKLKSTAKINALFLTIVLIAGTITLMFPSSITASAQTEQYYGMDKDRKSHGKDVSVKSVKCNNINVNVNGLELNLTSVPFLSKLLASEANEGERGAGSYGSDGNYGGGQSGSDKDFKFICINNNNNTVVGVNDDDNGTIPEPLTCETCFTTILTEEDLNGLIADFAREGIDSLQDICNFIDTNVQTLEGRTLISSTLFTSFRNAEISLALLEQLLVCLEQVYGVDFPRID